MRARDLPYGSLYLQEDLPDDMRGVVADLYNVPCYRHDCALLTIDHVLAPGFAGRILGYKRISDDLIFEVEFDCGFALLIWSGMKWIVSVQLAT